MYESFGLIGIQLHEKYKENFDVSSEGASTCAFSVCIHRIHRRTGRGGRGGSCPSPKRLQSRKVGQMFNISRAKSGKLKSQKAKKPPVCWANKGSRAIFASQSGNIGLL
jgi:hypothetical protein